MKLLALAGILFISACFAGAAGISGVSSANSRTIVKTNGNRIILDVVSQTNGVAHQSDASRMLWLNRSNLIAGIVTNAVIRGSAQFEGSLSLDKTNRITRGKPLRANLSHEFVPGLGSVDFQPRTDMATVWDGTVETICSGILSGYRNSISNNTDITYSGNIVGGGLGNSIVNGDACVVVGGFGNFNGPTDWNGPGNIACFVGAGQMNCVLDGHEATVVGGVNNTNATTNGAIVGGNDNSLWTATSAFIGAGDHNLITNSTSAVIAGGGHNRIDSASGAAIVGGANNLVGAAGAMAIGSYITNNEPDCIKIGYRTNAMSVANTGVVKAKAFVGSHSGDGGGLTNLLSSAAVYASGAPPLLAHTPLLLDFGTTDPSLTLTEAGVYLLCATARGSFTTIAGSVATVTLRKVSGASSDIPNASTTVKAERSLAFPLSGVPVSFNLPPVVYVAAANDVVQIVGSATVESEWQIDSAEIVAVKIR